MRSVGIGLIAVAFIVMIAAGSPVTSTLFGEGSVITEQIRYWSSIFYILVFVGFMLVFLSGPNGDPLRGVGLAALLTGLIYLFFNFVMVVPNV